MNKYKWTPLALTLAMSASLSHATSNPSGDVDIDNDGLIEIATLQELDLMRYDLAGTSLNGDSTGCPATGCNGYELVNDLDFDTNGNGVADAGDDFWNGGAGWKPVGDTGSHSYDQKKVEGAVTANFYGNGFSINNLFIDRPNKDWVGLFANIYRGNISNLVLRSANVTGSDAAGVLSGAINNSDISHIRISDSHLNGEDEVGLMAGRYYGNGNIINNINVNGNVSGDKYVGGIFGWSIRDKGANPVENNTFSNLISNVIISARYYAGGIGGFATGADVRNLVSKCDIEAVANYIGGVFGILGGGSALDIVSDCELSGLHDVGGAFGLILGMNISKVLVSPTSITKGSHPGGFSGRVAASTVSDSRVLGLVQGRFNASGLTNEVRGDVSVSNVYVGSNIVVTNNSAPEHKAGLIREIYYSGTTLDVTESYWDTDATGTLLSVSGYGEGKTTFDLQCPTEAGDVTCDASLYADWDETVWDFGTSTDYPVLR
jgi:hypothetical protein